MPIDDAGHEGWTQREASSSAAVHTEAAQVPARLPFLDKQGPDNMRAALKTSFQMTTQPLDMAADTAAEGQAAQTRKACSAGLLAMKRQSVWPPRRKVIDAPQWFGFVEADAREKELPELFGIAVHAHGEISGIPESAADVFCVPAKTERVQAPQLQKQAASLLTFPAMHAERSSPVPHRSKDGVLRFRAPAARQPILIFSLVGGVGGTSLAAGLTRVLANCGERVLLADAGGHTLLPHYFGGRGSRQGLVRTFMPPATSNSEMVSMLSLDVQSFAWNDEEMDRIFVEFAREAAGFDRVVWDLGNAPVEWCARLLRQGARVIVPLLPTAKCLMQLATTEAILQKGRKLGDLIHWQYVLNQFDEQDLAHVNIRGRFRGQLGERLLPFMLRNSPLVDEALLSGKTVIDHAPACPLVGGLWRLARSVAGLPQAYPEIVPGAWGEG